MASGDHHGSSRGRRGQHHDEHEEHVNHEAWVIPYADMLTLLMVMFLALFATGRVDLEKFRKLADNLAIEFDSPSANTGTGEGGVGDGGGDSIIAVGGNGSADGDGGILDGLAAPAVRPDDEELDALLADREEALALAALAELSDLATRLQAVATDAGLQSDLAVRFEGRGLVVTVVSDAVLFGPGSATLAADGIAVLDVVADALADVPNSVIVEGHTDSVPISSGRYPSNWELSTARATSVLRFLELTGIDTSRLSAMGYADTRPVADNGTAEGRAQNRRVEIVLLTDVALDPALDAPATPDDR